MLILVDSSIWVDFYKESSSQIADSLTALIQHDQVATSQPIIAELFSGRMNQEKKQDLFYGFYSFPLLDLDWNDQSVWKKIINLAESAYRHKISIPSIVDRMILLSAQTSKASIWTHDLSLKRLCEKEDVRLFQV